MRTVAGQIMALGIAVVATCAFQGPLPVVTETGFGPMNFGMTIEEAGRALGEKLVPSEFDDEVCRYYTATNGLAGVAFMSADGHFVRVDIFENTVATDAGARIGDSEARILELYKGRIEIRPHFYSGPEWHYLIVRSAGKIVLLFETDGATVQKYRAGLEPQIEYVEGCV